jgi:hypothetical protein
MENGDDFLFQQIQIEHTFPLNTRFKVAVKPGLLCLNYEAAGAGVAAGAGAVVAAGAAVEAVAEGAGVAAGVAVAAVAGAAA